MRRNERTYLWTFLVLGILSASRTAGANEQNWASNTIKWRVAKSLQVWFTQEIRTNDIAAYDDIFAKYVEFTVRHAPNKTFYWGGRYRHQWNEKGGLTIGEDRWTIEGGAKTAASPWLALDVSLRLDGKNYDRPEVEDYLWYRMRLRSTAATHIGHQRITPFLATELFATTQSTAKTFIDRHRLYVGAGFPIGNHFALVVDYIRQDIRDRETDHILRTVFEWSI